MSLSLFDKISLLKKRPTVVVKSTKQSRSPFLLIKDFLSPKYCQNIVNILKEKTKDNTKPSEIELDHFNNVVHKRISDSLPIISEYYNREVVNINDIIFEHYPEQSSGEIRCENSKFLRQKWVRILPNDLTGIIFLVDYNDQPPFDKQFEVFGGKLEFLQHNFGFNPRRGLGIIFPSSPHFLNYTSEIQYGDLYQIRFQLQTKEVFLYQPEEFPGDYSSWFKDIE